MSAAALVFTATACAQSRPTTEAWRRFSGAVREVAVVRDLHLAFVFSDRLVRVRATRVLAFTNAPLQVATLAILARDRPAQFGIADVCAGGTMPNAIWDRRRGISRGQPVSADDPELVTSFLARTTRELPMREAQLPPQEVRGYFAGPIASPQVLPLRVADSGAQSTDLWLVNEAGEPLLLTRAVAKDERVVVQPTGERADPFGALVLRVRAEPGLPPGERCDVRAEWRCGARTGATTFTVVGATR